MTRPYALANGALAVLVGFGASSHARAGEPAAQVPGEVRLAGAPDVQALCDEVGPLGPDASAERRTERDEALAGVYRVTLAGTSFTFSDYDTKRARLAVDTARGFRAKDGAYELVFHDLDGGVRAGAAVLDIAAPLPPKDADVLVKARKAGHVTLTIWFRVATPPGDRPVCATVHSWDGQGVRLAIEPLAFELDQSGQRVASGETSAFADLREPPPAAATPTVTIMAPTNPKGGKSPEAVAQAAHALEPDLLACYKTALAADATISGTLVVGVTLAADGKVTEARAELDGVGSSAVTNCALAKVKAAHFPKVDRFTLPIKFTTTPERPAQ